MPEAPQGDVSTHQDIQNVAPDGTETLDPNNLTEYQQEMLAKADSGLSAEKPTEQVADENQLLAGKYKTEEDLSKGTLELLQHKHPDMSLEEIYKGLETGTLFSQSDTSNESDVSSEQDSEDGDTEDGDTEDGDTEDSSQDNAGDFKWDQEAMNQEFVDNGGDLSEETKKALEGQGIPRETIETYLHGLRTIQDQMVNQIFDLAGGEESYTKMIEWVNKEVPEEDRIAYNKALDSQDMSTVKLAVEAMNNRFKTAAGSNPSLLRPNGGTEQMRAAGSYASRAEWLADMAKPEYQSNEAFRQSVLAKLAKSNI